MMKLSYLFTGLACSALLLGGCNLMNLDDEPEIVVCPPGHPLAATHWTLTATADGETGDIRSRGDILNEIGDNFKDDGSCLSLFFETPITFSGRGTINELAGTYEISYQEDILYINISGIGGTKMGGAGLEVETKFMEDLKGTHRIDLSMDSLKIFYKENGYFQFERDTVE
jgi:heat shock protein HslJ